MWTHSIAVGRATGAVNPTPVGVEHDRAALLRTSGGRAAGPWHAGMVLGSERANLLSMCATTKGQSGQSELVEHIDAWKNVLEQIEVIFRLRSDFQASSLKVRIGQERSDGLILAIVSITLRFWPPEHVVWVI